MNDFAIRMYVYMVGGLKTKQHYGQIFVLGAFFEYVFSPKGWQHNPPK